MADAERHRDAAAVPERPASAGARRGATRTTNDLGQFRLYGLPPGEYYVSATLRNMRLHGVDMIGRRTPAARSARTRIRATPPTYYPGTPSPGDAQRVTLAVGQELGSVDIQLQPVRLAKITGMAVGSDGKPMTGAMVMLMPAMKRRDACSCPAARRAPTRTASSRCNGVTPGEYSLQVQSMGAMITDGGRRRR